MDESKRRYCEKLWIEYKPQLYRTAVILLHGDLDDVEDVISCTYLALCEAVENGREFENPRAWLYSVMNNCFRKKCANTRKELDKKEEMINAEIRIYYHRDMLDEIIAAKDEEKVVEYIMENLTPSELKLYRLVHEKNLSMKEIAKKLGTSESAVKQANYRLTKKLKDLIREESRKI